MEQTALLEEAKTIRELRDFLNTVPDEFLDRRFVVHEEEEVHYVHILEYNPEDMLYDPENPDTGNMTMNEWEEYYPEVSIENLVIGIPKGCPLFTENF